MQKAASLGRQGDNEYARELPLCHRTAKAGRSGASGEDHGRTVADEPGSGSLCNRMHSQVGCLPFS